MKTESVRICGRWWRVRFLARVVMDGKRLEGHCDPNTYIIRVAASGDHDRQAATLRHELDHAIEFTHPDLTDEDDLTECRAQCWLQIERDHDWLRRFLRTT